MSTGALIAPLAFMGKKYDPVLRDSYTRVTAKDVMEMRGILDWLRYDSVEIPDEFDTAEMNRMFKRGYELARGNPWSAKPPKFQTPREATTPERGPVGGL